MKSQNFQIKNKIKSYTLIYSITYSIFNLTTSLVFLFQKHNLFQVITRYNNIIASISINIGNSWLTNSWRIKRCNKWTELFGFHYNSFIINPVGIASIRIGITSRVKHVQITIIVTTNQNTW